MFYSNVMLGTDSQLQCVLKVGQPNCLQPHTYLLASFKTDYSAGNSEGKEKLSADGLHRGDTEQAVPDSKAHLKEWKQHFQYW